MLCFLTSDEGGGLRVVQQHKYLARFGAKNIPCEEFLELLHVYRLYDELVQKIQGGAQ